MEIDRPITDSDLKDFLKNDSLGRNRDLSAILRILDCLKSESGAIIALDGAWGSGKTVLVKELEAIWPTDKNEYAGIKNVDSELIDSFKEHYIPCYYNAWENDYATDPAQSLLMNLGDFFNERKDIREKALRSLPKLVNVGSFVKEVSKGLIDVSCIGDGKPKLVPEVNRARKIRKEISDLIKQKIELKNDLKFLYIIDDLDRCKPTYAVELLEAIKHSFSNENIVFLVATNMPELSNIVSGYYGGKLNGGVYLDRIFDLNVSVSAIDMKKYLSLRLGTSSDYYALDIMDYLNFSMREANRYANVLKLCDAYFSNAAYGQDMSETSIYKFVFVPLFLAYKIKDVSIYGKLTSHQGFEYIEQYVMRNKQTTDTVRRLVAENAAMFDESLLIRLKDLYDELFAKIPYDEEVEKFWSIIGLTSNLLKLEN